MTESPSEAAAFVDRWKKQKARTTRVLRVIPEADLEWTPVPGTFTLGDLARHLAGIERYLYGENAKGRRSAYPGHERALAEGLPAVLAYVDRCHVESVEIFGSLTDAELSAKTATPAGTPITVRKWLRAMEEHEAHHRGQIYLLLGMRGVKTPPLYGLTSEEVKAASVPVAADR